jgi:hypothetical protein
MVGMLVCRLLTMTVVKAVVVPMRLLVALLHVVLVVASAVGCSADCRCMAAPALVVRLLCCNQSQPAAPPAEEVTAA